MSFFSSNKVKKRNEIHCGAFCKSMVINMLNEYNNVGSVVGTIPTGVGKSAIALEICDKTTQLYSLVTGKHLEFTLDNVLYETKNYFTFMKTAPPGTWLLVDEALVDLDAYAWASFYHRALKYAMGTGRYRIINVLTVLPDLRMLDINMIRLSDFLIKVRARGFATVHKWKHTGVGVQYTKWVGNLVGVKLPRKELWKEYCKLKDEKWKIMMANLENELTLRELQGKIAKSWYSANKYSDVEVMPSNESSVESVETAEEMTPDDILKEIKKS